METNFEKVKKELKKHKDGLIISEIARATKLSRNTVRAYVERLIGEKSVKVRTIGIAKLIKYIK